MLNNFSAYFAVAKFSSLLVFKAYPMDIVLFTARRILELVFTICFWGLIIKGTNITLIHIIAYFMIAGGISEIVMLNGIRLGNSIRELLYTGELSNYMIKPMNTILFLYFRDMGNRVVVIIVSIINIIIGLILNAILIY